ncbi:hypothetical protein FOL47_003175 [Perkinsus chesapeaki]|uniref:Cupin-like domain-containing protein n=1 Tax=Perkinsus chesapeaki TaxID=330153 RepID=A0A7J6MAR7_PERCH|nr:hypothetical protein FOL47_003175 [Perkinsus chesapeaki]
MVFFIKSIVYFTILHHCGSITIWETGKRQGQVPVLKRAPSPRKFYDKFADIPFVIRSAGLVDPSDRVWSDEGLLEALGPEYELSAVEVELVETRTIPAMRDFPLGKTLRAGGSIPLQSGIDSDAYGWIDVEDFPEHKAEFPKVYGAFAARVNISDVDVRRFPAWKDVVWWETTLRPGDCLYMPPWWFHHVESGGGRTVSSHIWFNKPLTWYGFAPTCDDEENPTSTYVSDCEYYDINGNDTRASFKSQTSLCERVRHDEAEL